MLTGTATIWTFSALAITLVVVFGYFCVFWGIFYLIGWGVAHVIRPIANLIGHE